MGKRRIGKGEANIALEKLAKDFDEAVEECDPIRMDDIMISVDDIQFQFVSLDFLSDKYLRSNLNLHYVNTYS